MEQKSYKIIALTPENIAEYGVCGYKDVKKHLELRRKIDWFRKFGTFCIIKNGRVISHHPISNTRFENIMK
jgi:hypothetical protein